MHAQREEKGEHPIQGKPKKAQKEVCVSRKCVTARTGKTKLELPVKDSGKYQTSVVRINFKCCKKSNTAQGASSLASASFGEAATAFPVDTIVLMEFHGISWIPLEFHWISFQSVHICSISPLRSPAFTVFAPPSLRLFRQRARHLANIPRINSAIKPKTTFQGLAKNGKSLPLAVQQLSLQSAFNRSF